MPIQTGHPYVFGPFQLSLPDGWTGEMIDQVHELQPPDESFAIHISGYERSTPVTVVDLHNAARQLFSAEGVEFTLPSGLDGVSFDTESEDGHMRYWLLHWENAMIVITLTSDAEHLPNSAVPAQLVVSSIRPSGE
ncbi:MAG: hypothetical protein AAF557_21150 [Pseudomonadota bacterium]